MLSASPLRHRPRQIRLSCLAASSAADAMAIAALLLLTAIAVWPLIIGGTMVGQDTAAFFYPIFIALGRRLAAGDLPGWNPHQFAGVPFAADPESGWMYLPAMLLFTVLPVALAAKLWILGHLLLAGLGAYALGRVLGLGAAGALGAAVAYEFSGLLYARTVCCPAYSQVAAWLPAVLVASELAMRSDDWRRRLAWWAVAGLGLSQIFVAWLGQGAYYALLAFAGYVTFRILGTSLRHAPRLRSRLLALLLHCSVPVLIGFGMAAAAILPRLAANPRTNLAAGYSGDLAWAAILGGWDPATSVERLLRPSFYYAGGATLALAIAALILFRTRHAAPYFALLATAALLLAQEETTWLHRTLYALLPRFAELHRHWPERDMVVFILGPAMLAGMAIHAAGLPRSRHVPLVAAAFFPLFLVLALERQVAPIAPAAMRATFIAAAGLLVIASLPAVKRRLVAPLLVLVLFVDLFAAGRYNLDHGWYGGFHKENLATYFERPPVASFLQARQVADGEPSRFFGYDPSIYPNDGSPPLYRYQFADPRAAALLLNNRAEIFGLDDVQGYNPVQPQRYVEFMRALNGFAQEYHEGNVYPSGLASPLLDLLNARYILVPPQPPPGRWDIAGLIERYPTVYTDSKARVLENRAALPRAWIVHEARQVPPEQALSLLALGGVDPRHVALVETAPPPLATSSASKDEQARIVVAAADHLRVEVETGTPGLLLLSEPADPDWRATVDGASTPIITADYLLRAIPIPAGAHTIDLRHESPTLRAGTIVSLLTYLGALLTWSTTAWRSPRPRRR